MVLPLYASLERLDWSLLEAAADLGARRCAAFLPVTLPLTLPGILAGLPAGLHPGGRRVVIPELLGGPGTLMIGRLLWQEFFDNVDWPLAAALAMALVLVLCLPLLLAQARRAEAGVRRPLLCALPLALGFAFLYLPIVVLIAYSFNESRLVTVWGGFSTRWYGELFGNEKSARRCGWPARCRRRRERGGGARHLAALAMNRIPRFRGRALFGADMTPLVVPEVITGLSLLLLFVLLGDTIGWPGRRGATTITLAHTTFGLAFATVVIRARLSQLDPALEQAAADLGATPWRAFRRGDAAIAHAGDRRGLAAGVHALARRPGDRQLRHRSGRLDPADRDLLQRAARRVAPDQCARDLACLGGRCADRRCDAYSAAGRGRTGTKHLILLHFNKTVSVVSPPPKPLTSCRISRAR